MAPIDVEFKDNRFVVDLLLAKPLGVFALLDEESNFPRATDASLVGNYKVPLLGEENRGVERILLCLL